MSGKCLLAAFLFFCLFFSTQEQKKHAPDIESQNMNNLMSELKMLMIFDRLKTDLSKTDTEDLIHEINRKTGKSPGALILFASVEMDCSPHTPPQCQCLFQA